MTSETITGRNAFKSKCDAFGTLFEAGRISALIDMFYADDAVLEGQGLPPHHGKAAIRRIYEETRHACEAIRIQLEPVTVVGDLGYGCITNTNLRIDGRVETHRGMMVWHRTGDDWFVVHDFFFTDFSAGAALSWSNPIGSDVLLP